MFLLFTTTKVLITSFEEKKLYFVYINILKLKIRYMSCQSGDR